MTTLFKQTNPKRPIDSHLAIGYDEESKRLLYFENTANKIMNFDVESFDKYSNIKFRTDVTDCFIDICSPSMLELFKDNFDWEDTRTDFLKEYILSDDETNVNLNFVVCDVITNDYISRVTSLRTYEIISKEIIKRWVYPIVPDSNFTGTSYR
jgi:translation initiation factor eIF-2B subunit epsilon